MAKYSEEQLEIIKRLIKEGEASPSQIMEFGYLVQEPTKLDRPYKQNKADADTNNKSKEEQK